MHEYFGFSNDMIESKLDDGLLAVLRHPYSRTGRFPVMVVAADGALDDLQVLLRQCGEIRFVLEPLNAISVWLTLDSVERVAQQPWVLELEIAHEVEIAE